MDRESLVEWINQLYDILEICDRIIFAHGAIPEGFHCRVTAMLQGWQGEEETGRD